MDVIFARQPILDVNNKLFGYELLFRKNAFALESGGDSGAYFDGEKATAYILEILGSMSIMEITGGRKAFVNFTENLILQGYAKLFPPKYLVIEILENTPPTPKLLEMLKELKGLGYTIALDDFIFDKKYQPLIDLADIIKVEVRMNQESINNLITVLKIAGDRKCKVLAERVETQEMYDACVYAGCHYFQGYFFAKPVTILKPTLEINSMNYIRLVAFVNQSEIQFDQIARIIKRDVALTYKLLTLVNSSYYSRGNIINDIQQALVMLGIEDLKKWVSFISIHQMCNDKPSELIKMSVIRAIFCSQMAMATGYDIVKESFFLVGLFSLLEALMDTTIEIALSNVNIPGDVLLALKGDDNILSHMLNIIKGLEIGDWDMVENFRTKFNCDNDEIMQVYLDSIKFGNEFD